MALPAGPLTKTELKGTLTAKLSPIADKIRTVAVKLGLRPYRVFLVRMRWTGGERGRGIEEVVEWNEVWPPPRISIQDQAKPGGILRDLTSWGMLEEGTVVVSGISLSYSEDQLLGIREDGPGIGMTDIPKNEEFYWEIREDGSSTLGPRRRRFHPDDAPARKPLGWQVSLRKSEKNPPRVAEGAGTFTGADDKGTQGGINTGYAFS